MRQLPLILLCAFLACGGAARAQEETDAAPEEKAVYLVTVRIIELPLWRLNEALKQQPVALAEARDENGAQFLRAVVRPTGLLALEHRLSAYGSARDFPRLVVTEGDKSGLTVTGRREVIAGSEPTLHPKRGIVFRTRTETVPLTGLSLTANCMEAPGGVLVTMEIELLDNIEGAGERVTPVVVKRRLSVAESVEDGGAVMLVPSLGWHQVENELDPRVQVLLIRLKKAAPEDLL